jgi:hypothetical protein
MGYDGADRRTVKFLPHARLLLALSLGLLCSSTLALIPRFARAESQGPAAAVAPHFSAHASPAQNESGYHYHYQRAVGPIIRSCKVVNVSQLCAERRARVEQAPLHSRRILLPEFVLSDDAPDDEDLANLRAPQLQYFPGHAQLYADEVARSPRLPTRELLERPPRA